MYKKINRNPFNEKLIHRYLFERYYFSERAERNKLLPKRFHKSEINLIVPEENTPKNYRADLSLYFKGSKSAVPVEVKWTAGGFNKPNQVKYLTENDGFVVAFGAQKEMDVDYVEIDTDDFTKWVSLNVSKLVRESLSQQVSDHSVSNQYWIVYLVGGAFDNFHKMLSEFSSKPFWAFKQNRTALRNILDLQKGDKVLFVLGKSDNQAMLNDPKQDWVVKEWYECTIKEPYYMNLSKESGNFFERSAELPVNERKWPHFVSFTISDKCHYREYVNIGKRGKYSKPIADSVNYGGGVPMALARNDYESLTDLLRLTKEQYG